MTTQDVSAVELRMIPVERIRIREGHNARAHVGDVTELADSIRANGVLQALTVEELPAEDNGPVYALIAGERRLTAARLVELAEVPCLVRQGLDERARTAAMLVENLQRRDLEPLEEASGIRRLVELGLSQREIARELGCSQGHVSKRLSLLELPEPIRTAIGQAQGDFGGITVGDALELVKLAHHPERQAEAFERGRRGYYGGIGGMVRHHQDELEAERKRAEARAHLQSAGVKILKEEQYYHWYGRKERPLLGCGPDPVAIKMTVEQHQGEPCHAAAIDGRGGITYVCRDPSRHPGLADPNSERARQQAQEQERERVQNRLRREAAEARRTVMGRVLAAANTSRLPFAGRQVLASWRVNESRVACDLLGLEPAENRYGSRDYTETLSAYAGASMAAAIRALLALALATGEERVSSTWGGPSPASKRHLELLAAAGYEPNDSDRRHLTGEAEEDEDQPVCRSCGCTDEEPCHGGCQWVSDPEEMGDLCSRCLAEIEVEEEEEEEA